MSSTESAVRIMATAVVRRCRSSSNSALPAALFALAVEGATAGRQCHAEVKYVGIFAGEGAFGAYCSTLTGTAVHGVDLDLQHGAAGVWNRLHAARSYSRSAAST